MQDISKIPKLNNFVIICKETLIRNLWSVDCNFSKLQRINIVQLWMVVIITTIIAIKFTIFYLNLYISISKLEFNPKFLKNL